MREIFLQAATLWQREIVRFIRQPIRVMSAIATPLVFWLLLGAGLQASFKPSGMPAAIGYAQYFYPGVIVLMLLFTAIFATASTVDDRRQGFLQGVLVAPISRATIVLGQALGCTTLSLMQGAIFLAMAPLAGIRLSLEAIAVSAAMMAVIAFASFCKSTVFPVLGAAFISILCPFPSGTIRSNILVESSSFFVSRTIFLLG